MTQNLNRVAIVGAGADVPAEVEVVAEGFQLPE